MHVVPKANSYTIPSFRVDSPALLARVLAGEHENVVLCAAGQVRRTSAGTCPPPLEYEASEELQQELEAAAPDEFMCPIGR